MSLVVRVIPSGEVKVIDLSSPIKVVDLLRMLGYNPEAVVVVRGGEVLTEDRVVRPGEEVLIYMAYSGG